MYALFFSEETHEIYCNQVAQDEGNKQGLLAAQTVQYQTSPTTLQYNILTQ